MTKIHTMVHFIVEKFLITLNLFWNICTAISFNIYIQWYQYICSKLTFYINIYWSSSSDNYFMMIYRTYPFKIYLGLKLCIIMGVASLSDRWVVHTPSLLPSFILLSKYGNIWLQKKQDGHWPKCQTQGFIWVHKPGANYYHYYITNTVLGSVGPQTRRK